MNNISRK